MPLSFRPGEPMHDRPLRAHPGDARVRPYDTGYDVLRGYEAAPAEPRGPDGEVAWFGGRRRRRD
jgi:hypothetical protein